MCFVESMKYFGELFCAQMNHILSKNVRKCAATNLIPCTRLKPVVNQKTRLAGYIRGLGFKFVDFCH